MTPRERNLHRLAAALIAVSVAGLVAIAGLAVGGCYYAPPVEQPPVVVPPVEPPPTPGFPPPEPIPAPGLPAVGSTRAEVEAAWGKGVDLPENPGEPDAVSYVRTLDGKEVEVHVIYRDGRVSRVVVSALVTPQ